MRKTTKYRRFELAAKDVNMAVQQTESVLAQTPGKIIDMLSWHAPCVIIFKILCSCRVR
jgi:hypothetical protein